MSLHTPFLHRSKACKVFNVIERHTPVEAEQLPDLDETIYCYVDVFILLFALRPFLSAFEARSIKLLSLTGRPANTRGPNIFRAVTLFKVFTYIVKAFHIYSL